MKAALVVSDYQCCFRLSAFRDLWIVPDMSLYFVVGAQQQDLTLDPVRYLAEPAKLLGLIKRPRKPPKQKAQAPLDSA